MFQILARNLLDCVADGRFGLGLAAARGFALRAGITAARYLPIEACSNLAPFGEGQARIPGKDEFS